MSTRTLSLESRGASIDLRDPEVFVSSRQDCFSAVDGLRCLDTQCPILYPTRTDEFGCWCWWCSSEQTQRSPKLFRPPNITARQHVVRTYPPRRRLDDIASHIYISISLSLPFSRRNSSTCSFGCAREPASAQSFLMTSMGAECQLLPSNLSLKYVAEGAANVSESISNQQISISSYLRADSMADSHTGDMADLTIPPRPIYLNPNRVEARAS